MPIPSVINDSMIREANRIAGRAITRQSARSPWATLMPKAIFQPGMGFEQTSVLFERSGFTNDHAWADLGVNNGSTNSCVLPADTISPASTTYTHKLQGKNLESDPFCWHDLYTAWQVQDQIKHITDQFADRVTDMWEERDRAQYTAIARHKAVFSGGQLLENSASFPTTEPDSQASNALMAYVYQRLCQDGADQESEVGKQNGAPVFLAFMSMEQSAALTQEGDTRDDIRWSSKVDTLLQPFAITRVQNGFAHKIDVKAPRYDLIGGVWTERPFYSPVAATNGFKLEVNPDYINAEFEDIHIFLRNVVERQMPQSMSAFGPAHFNPQNFIGQFRWINEYDHDRNPDKNIGYFRANLVASYRPLNPNLGWVIRVKRCPDAIKQNFCPTVTTPET